MNNKGVTLIELILTLTILTVIMVIVIPKTNNNAYLNSISKELLYDIRDLRTRSMTSDNSYYSMVIAPNRYYITKSSAKEGRKIIKIVDLKPNYTLNSSNRKRKVEFSYNGRPRYPTTITIMNTKKNKHKQISIVPDTGRILLIE